MENTPIIRPNNQVMSVSDTVLKYVSASISPKTVRAYESGIRLFKQWKEDTGNDSPVEWLAYRASQGLSLSALKQNWSAIIFLSKLLSTPLTTQQRDKASLIIKGASRIASEEGRQVDRKEALTVDVLYQILPVIDKNTVKGIRDKAIILLGFSGMYRRSEIVSLNIEDLKFTNNGVLVTLNRSKTDQSGQGLVKFITKGKNDNTCPVKALRDWLKIVNRQSGSIFTRVRKGGILGDRLSDQSVAHMIKKYADLSGLDSNLFSGHSLRSGGITTAANAGASLSSIMTKSGHKSVQTVQRYIHIVDIQTSDPLAGTL